MLSSSVEALRGEFFEQAVEVSALDLQYFGGLRLVATSLLQESMDVTFFKIVQGLLERAWFEKLVRNGR